MTKAEGASDGIEHIIVLMLENRSFDHMLSALSGELPIDGLPKAGEPVRANSDTQGNRFEQAAGASRTIRFDPHHECRHVLAQLHNGNQGFVDDFSRAYPSSRAEDRAEIMKYHSDLPALFALARNFTVCDRWFASVPGPTWCNRFFVHSGTSLGRVEMPDGILDANLHWYDQVTLYDRLNEQQKSWRIYYGDIPQSLILVNQLEPQNACNYKKMLQFYQDVARHPKAPFPAYCFIEPSYYQPGANDDHPTHDLSAGDRLIASVYNALRANGDLWSKCLLVVLYDEHGGFYDHVTPGKTVAPDHHQEEYSFTQLGVRVPAILISPHVDRGSVVHTEFDHTSLLRYLIDKWSLGPLGARAQQANSIAAVLKPTVRADCPKQVPTTGSIGASRMIMAGRPVLSAHQTALLAMTQLLESMTESPGDSLRSRSARMIVGFDGAVDVGMQRTEEFLAQFKC